jgi:alkanesulfonate monooxygenase
MSERPLEFGWFIPTSGDTTCYGDPAAAVPPSMEMFERVARAAERVGLDTNGL